MQLIRREPGPPARDIDLFSALVPLHQARILELGCGAAVLTRAIAEQYPDAHVTALEVDRVQHARNLEVRDLSNVAFGFGGADDIPAPDGGFDVVLMAKSLHHVPVHRMERALTEIARVLRPGGLAYFSEPVYAGEFNAVMSIFHDEKRVREAAFATLERAVASGLFELAAEEFYSAARRFANFEDFERRMIGVTHTDHRLTAAQMDAVRERFARSVGDDGAIFHQPMRVDVLRRLQVRG
jgi:ubiquinone/menaquinone biosynthesis C-methylase UbiE